VVIKEKNHLFSNISQVHDLASGRRTLLKRGISSSYVALVALFFITHNKVFAEDSKVFQIPQISGISVDGSPEDWGSRGLYVEFLAAPDGGVLPVDDFDVRFRLGWNREGLFVLAFVRDDVAVEHEDRSRLWQRDCVELFFSDFVGSSNRHQVVISSGADPEHKEIRYRIYDWRLPDQKTRELKARVASQVHVTGSVVEVLLPWDNIGITPSLGLELGFQFIANDDDGAGDSNGPLRLAWYPAVGPHSRFSMHSLRLSETPSQPVTYRIRREITQKQYTVSIQGIDKLIDKPVALHSADEVIARAKMDKEEGRARQMFELDPVMYPDTWPQVEVMLGGQIVARYEALSTLDHILDTYIEALGGRDAIAELTSRVCEGSFVDDLSWQEPRVKTSQLRAYAKMPDKWATVLKTTKGTEQNGFDETQSRSHRA
jgi:hypothetical protein